jgi:hypothetical protein
MPIAFIGGQTLSNVVWPDGVIIIVTSFLAFSLFFLIIILLLTFVFFFFYSWGRLRLVLNMSMLAWPNSTRGTIPRSICSDSCPNGYIRNFQVK